MMGDENLIACLYPAGTVLSTCRGIDTIRQAPDSMYRAPLLLDHVVGPESPQSASPARHRLRIEKPAAYHYSPGIQLRFDQRRKNQMGFVLGKDDSCDVVFPRTESLRGTGERQCVITFDARGRLVLRDLREPRLGSETTRVAYSGQWTPGRRGFTWLLSGEDFTRMQVSIGISFHSNLHFQIVVAPHDIRSPLYRANVAWFRNNGVHAPVLQNLASQHHAAGMQALGPRAILVRYGELGRGAQAVVVRVWDVSTGSVYACKEALDKTCKEQQDRLRTEAKLLGRVNHPNIVRIVHFMKRPTPTLVLEWIPLQSLEEQILEKPLSAEEMLSLLRQSLSALMHLHEREKPIVHRDIKPANILVQSRSPRLHIKLCDFGYSKANRNFLATKVGTPYFTAPEVFTEEVMCEPVDIWSLGIVILLQSHGLPRDDCPCFDGDAYAWRVVWFLNALTEATSCPLIDFLSCNMLVRNPVARIPAFGCELFAEGLCPSPCCCRLSSLPNPYTETTPAVMSRASLEPQAYQQAPREERLAVTEGGAGGCSPVLSPPAALPVRSAVASPGEQSDPGSRQRGFGDKASPWNPMQARQRQRGQDGRGKEREN